MSGRSTVALVVSAGLVLSLVLGARAQSREAKAELQELEKRYERSNKSYPDRAKELQPGYEAIARKWPGTEEALTAKLWLLSNLWWARDDPKTPERARQMAEQILAEHPKSRQLAKIAVDGYLLAEKYRRPFYEKLLSVSPVDEVKAAALIGLGRDGLRDASAEKEEARGRLREVIEKYKDVPYRLGTAGDMADALLNPHPAAALEIGQPAPEIVGKTADGKPLKLSDFRGKVVVLDFFGDW